MPVEGIKMDVLAWQGRRPNEINKERVLHQSIKKSPGIAMKTGLYDLRYGLSVIAIEQATEAAEDASFFFSAAGVHEYTAGQAAEWKALNPHFTGSG